MIATFNQDDFPEALAVKMELLPWLFPLHMLSGALALVLLPLTLLLRHRPALHRPAGRLTAVIVIIAGVTAFPVAWAEPVTWWSAAGFSAQGTVWLILLALALWHIRHGRSDDHRRMMLLMTATTSGAIFFRVYLALWAIWAQGRHFELFYACDAWLAWLLPLATCAFLLKQAGSDSANPG